MDVSVAFSGANKAQKAIGARPKVAAVNLTGEAMRQHERMIEYRNQANAVNVNFQSAMTALSAANADVGRLNAENSKMKAEIERLQGELQNEREKNARSGKKTQKPQRQNGDADASICRQESASATKPLQ